MAKELTFTLGGPVTLSELAAIWYAYNYMW